MKASNTQWKLITLLVLLNLVAMAAWIVVYVEARGAKVGFEKAREELAGENKKEAYVAMATKDLRESASARAFLDTLFIREGEEVAFLERVESLGAHAGVSVKVLDFQKKDSALSLTVRTEGAFAPSHYFLELLEALPYSLTVRTARLEETVGEGGRLFWQGTHEITLNSYLPKP